MAFKHSIYFRYGSRVTSGVAELLYDRILADPALAPFFVDIDMDVLREHMADVLTVVAGGPDIYRGRDLFEAHAKYRITREDFLAVAAHLEASLIELEIAPADIETILAAVGDTADQIINA